MGTHWNPSQNLQLKNIQHIYIYIYVYVCISFSYKFIECRRFELLSKAGFEGNGFEAEKRRSSSVLSTCCLSKQEPEMDRQIRKKRVAQKNIGGFDS